MTKDKYKEKFAAAISDAFGSLYPDDFSGVDDKKVVDSDSIYQSLESPKDPRMGRFALPLFRFAGKLKKRPNELSAIISEEVNRILSSNGTANISCSQQGGFINAKVDPETLARETITTILISESHYADSDVGGGKKFLIEYSSPNIAKPFGIGHLRTTAIGNCLRRIFKKIGYDTVGINYPGDWGTQFGKMIVAYRKWGDESTFEGDAISKLVLLYQRFHREVENEPSLEDEARLAFKNLEEGEADTVKLWEKFKTVSHAEFDRVYGALGVEFDLVIAESFFNDKMAAVIDRLEKAGLTTQSRGALIVDIKDERLPPLLLRKQDGATLYSTRDLAGLVYRWETYKFEESLYVVGSSQSDHFKQCFKVIELLEEAEGNPESERMTGRVKHIPFGWVLFGGKAMSTREGRTILLDEVIKEAVNLAKEKINEKNPELADKDKVAHQIGVGAILFSQLSVRRIKDVSFIWDEVLNFDGDSGPYLQYTHARLSSLLRRADRDIEKEIDFSLLIGEEEQRIVELLADFPSIIFDTARQYEPVIITTYLFKLAAAFNTMYQRKDSNGRIDRIVSDDLPLTNARLALVKSVQTVMKEGLYLLGLESPSEV